MSLSPDVRRDRFAAGAPRVRTAGIAGLGTALPAGVVANEVIGARLGVDGAWIERRTGIRSRRHAERDSSLSDLAAEAGVAALEGAMVAADEVDLVLVATLSQDQLTPNAAPQVAHALGATRAGAVDIGAACTGFLSGLALGSSCIEARRAEHVLLIGAEILSRHVDRGDKRTAGLFGDGAGAVVLSAGAPGRIGGFVLGSDGGQEASQLIHADRDPGLIRMDGHETFLRAVAALTSSTHEALALADLELDDIDRFVFHQANGRILSAVANQLAVDPDRVVDAIADIGNTSAASIPLALAHANPRPGERLLLGAVGAGLTWGACVVEWGSA